MGKSGRAMRAMSSCDSTCLVMVMVGIIAGAACASIIGLSGWGWVIGTIIGGVCWTRWIGGNTAPAAVAAAAEAAASVMGTVTVTLVPNAESHNTCEKKGQDRRTHGLSLELE